MRHIRRRVVLIADDHRDTREMYAQHLTDVGYEVHEAADGSETVTKAVALRPAVIVLDLVMPEVDGWTTLEMLRATAELKDIPVIVLTGHDLKHYLKAAAIAVGARSYLIKPCLPVRLQLEIDAHLRAPSRSQQTAG